MVHSQLNICILLLLGAGLTNLQAQQSVNTAGGSASGNEGSVTYSVGQVFFQTHSGTNGTVAEGVQQPIEIIEITGIEEAQDITLSATVYPNPATEYLTLSINEFDLTDLSYQLYDMNGNLLQNERVTGKMTKIVMSNLASAHYIIKVMMGHKEVKTFKVIKR